MSDLDDLGFTSISDMSTDEALETLRQIRLSRRTPKKSSKKKKTSKRVTAKAAPSVDADTAAELLKILGGSNGDVDSH